jgi:hypothetical protein
MSASGAFGFYRRGRGENCTKDAEFLIAFITEFCM